MRDVEEGADELLGCATVIAEADSCGQIEYPDADQCEGDEAGDPGGSRRDVALLAGDEEASFEWEEEKASAVPRSLGSRAAGSGCVCVSAARTSARIATAMSVWRLNQSASRLSSRRERFRERSIVSMLRGAFYCGRVWCSASILGLYVESSTLRLSCG